MWVRDSIQKKSAVKIWSNHLPVLKPVPPEKHIRHEELEIPYWEAPKHPFAIQTISLQKFAAYQELTFHHWEAAELG